MQGQDVPMTRMVLFPDEASLRRGLIIFFLKP